MHLGFMDLIILYNGHQHVSAIIVANFRVVTKKCVHNCYILIFMAEIYC